MNVTHNILDKYRTMSLPAKAGLWFTLSNILLRGISFITLPIFSRLLSTDEMGVVTLFQSWTTLLCMIVALNVWTGGFNVGLTKFEDKSEEFVTSSQGLGICICLIFTVVSSFKNDWISNWLGLSETLTRLVFVQILFMIPVNIWVQKNKFTFSYRKVVSVSTITAVLNPFLGYLLVVRMQEKDFARILGFVIVEACIGIACFLLNIKGSISLINKSYWKYLFVFNFALLPHFLSTQILNQSDRVMIAKLCGTSDAGIYGVAYTFAMLMTLVTGGIETVVTPYTFKSLKANRLEELKKGISFCLSAIAVGAIILMCVIPDIFRFMLPESYYEAIYIIPIVICAAYFQFVFPLFGNVELFFGEKKYVTIASCVGAIANIALNYVFINLFGYVAAAYTTLFCYILFCFFHYCFMNIVLKKREYRKVYDIKVLIIISAFLLASTFVILALYQNTYARYGIIITAIIVIALFRNRIIEMSNHIAPASKA